MDALRTFDILIGRSVIATVTHEAVADGVAKLLNGDGVLFQAGRDRASYVESNRAQMPGDAVPETTGAVTKAADAKAPPKVAEPKAGKGG